MEHCDILDIISPENDEDGSASSFCFNLQGRQKQKFMMMFVIIKYLIDNPTRGFLLKQHCINLSGWVLNKYKMASRCISASSVYMHVFSQDAGEPLKLSEDCCQLPTYVICLYLLDEVRWENIQYHFKHTRRVGWDK